jgi:hypothetical protein
VPAEFSVRLTTAARSAESFGRVGMASQIDEVAPYRPFCSGRVASVRPDSATRKSLAVVLDPCLCACRRRGTPALAWSRLACGVRLLRGVHEVSIEQRQFGLIWRLELDPGFVEQLS